MLLSLTAAVCHAGNPFAPDTEGMTLKYAVKDKKGKIISYSTQRVSNITTKNGDTVITIVNETTGPDGKPFTTKDLPATESSQTLDEATQAEILQRGMDILGTTQTVISHGRVVTPMDSVKDMIDRIKSETANVEGLDFIVNADEVSYPVEPHEGEELAPASISLSLSMEGKTMEIMKMTVLNRKIIGRETVTVAAGAFDCWKVTETLTMKTPLGKAFSTTVLTWYADSIGAVLSQTLDKRGKIENTSELVSLSRR